MTTIMSSWTGSYPVLKKLRYESLSQGPEVLQTGNDRRQISGNE